MVQIDPDQNTIASKWTGAGSWRYPDEDFQKMKRFKQNLDGDHLSTHLDLDTRNALRDPDRKSGFSSMKVMGIFVAGLIVFSVLFSVNVVLRDPPSDAVFETSKARVLEVEHRKGNRFKHNF